MTDAAYSLPDDMQTLKAMLVAREAEIERLRQIIKELQRHRFGRRAESLPEDQLLLGLKRPSRSRRPGTRGTTRPIRLPVKRVLTSGA